MPRFAWAFGDFPSVSPPGLPTAPRSTGDPPTPSRSGPALASPSPTPTRATGRPDIGAVPPASSWEGARTCLGWSFPSPWVPGTVPTQPENALLETADEEGGERARDLDFSQKTVMESSYCRGQAAALLRELTWFPFFPFSLLDYFQNCSLIDCLGKPKSILSSL